MRDVKLTPDHDIFDMKEGRMKMSLTPSILLDIAYKARMQAREQLARMKEDPTAERRTVVHYEREISEIENFIFLLQRTHTHVEVDNVFLSRLIARYAVVKEEEPDNPLLET